MAPRHTLVHRIMDWARQRPNETAIHARKADGKSWRSFTWRQYLTALRETAKGLMALGLQPGQCVGLVGANAPEWVICQFAIMAAGGIPAPIYATNTDEQVAYILGHCACEIAVCDDAAQLAKYEAAKQLDKVKVEKIVTTLDIPGGDYTLDALRALGRKQDDAELDARIEALDPEKTCLLIYTSGTTGVPKAVELTHVGLILVGDGVKAMLPADLPYKVISYLPLCHVAEQVVTNVGSLAMGGEVFFCPDLKQVKDYLAAARPTLFLGVPRVWEKFEAAMRTKIGAATGIKAKLATWAMRTEFACFKKGVETGRPVGGLGRFFARQLVINKVKGALGFDRLAVAATGAAPIGVGTLEFFASLGIPIVEVFGMSETSGVATMTDPARPMFGTVGKPIPGVEIKIADDDEILLKGKNMTSGYLHMAEESKELYDADGWLLTGDLGKLDNGNLSITGRKKDLIITAGGKNVAPGEMETLIASIDGVGQAVVVGDRQPYLCVLIAFDPETLPAFCDQLGIPRGSIPEVAKNPQVQAFFEQKIKSECNAKVARYQTIKKFEIVPNEFSVEGGEVTPTMKVKRNNVNKKYAALIDSMYVGVEQGGAKEAPPKAATT